MFASRHFPAHLALKSPKRLSGQVLDHNQPQDESGVHDTPEIGAEHEKVNVRGCRLGKGHAGVLHCDGDTCKYRQDSHAQFIVEGGLNPRLDSSAVPLCSLGVGCA